MSTGQCVPDTNHVQDEIQECTRLQTLWCSCVKRACAGRKARVVTQCSSAPNLLHEKLPHNERLRGCGPGEEVPQSS